MTSRSICFRLSLAVVSLAALAACSSTSPSSNPSITVNPVANGVPASGATGLTFAVSTTNVTSWTATSDTPFVTITGGATGTTDGTVTYSVGANVLSTTRVAHITVMGTGNAVASFTINQTGTTSSPAIR